MEEFAGMRIHIVCRTDQLDWILGKITKKLVGELEPWAEVSVGPQPCKIAHVNHYVWYDDFRDYDQPSTIGITHIDSLQKFKIVKEQLSSALAGICLSSKHMEDLFHAGIPRQKLCYVTPAHDGDMQRKRINIGITTRLYAPDPCKREWMLEDLASQIDPLDYKFSIMGAGWRTIVDNLKERGFDVRYYSEFELESYRELVPTFDYYLYLGWDEGSMGLLDALHAGVPTIATSQGFHLDILGGLTHPVDDINSVVSVFRKIAEEKNARTNSVRNLTWQKYAARHLEIWRYLLYGRKSTCHDRRFGGLHSLLDRELTRDPARANEFLSELKAIDKKRDELHRLFVTTPPASLSRRLHSRLQSLRISLRPR